MALHSHPHNLSPSHNLRQTKLNELRHQMRYTGSSSERHRIRVELDFWRRLPLMSLFFRHPDLG